MLGRSLVERVQHNKWLENQLEMPSRGMIADLRRCGKSRGVTAISTLEVTGELWRRMVQLGMLVPTAPIGRVAVLANLEVLQSVAGLESGD